MNWINLSSILQLEELKSHSYGKSIAIFKHSTRCSISVMIKSRLEKDLRDHDIDIYYLDLLNYRDISNKIASDFNVYHESPQILIIQSGICIYDESHNAIYADDILKNMSSIQGASN